MKKRLNVVDLGWAVHGPQKTIQNYVQLIILRCIHVNDGLRRDGEVVHLFENLSCVSLVEPQFWMKLSQFAHHRVKLIQ